MIFEPGRLSTKARRTLTTFGEDHAISIVTLWEIVVKAQLGKLELAMPVDTFLSEFIEKRSVTVLDIEFDDLSHYARLPLHHRDPFDRLLIAQAQSRRLKLISVDAAFAPYAVDVLW